MSTIAKQLKLTQTKSIVGRCEHQRRILRGLGLHGMNTTVVVANDPSFRGAVKKVLHLVTVEEING
jgi:large subunit ribosomal protein L30